MLRKMMMVLAAISVSACSFVQLTPDGEKVRVLSASEVTKCRNLGQTTVSVMSKIGSAERREDVMQDELNVVARNSAADMNGDTVVPLSPIKDGKQTFGVYHCMPD